MSAPASCGHNAKSGFVSTVPQPDSCTAANRIAIRYGRTLPRSDIPKGAGDTLVTSFMAKCDQVMLAEGCDRTEAMRRVRKRHEGLFDAFQLV
jgi:hypothetical protein